MYHHSIMLITVCVDESVTLNRCPLPHFKGLRGVSVRSTSVSVAATPACTGDAALRGRGRPCMAASLCCLNATTNSMLQATSAAVLQEQQVIYSHPPGGIHHVSHNDGCAVGGSC